MRTTNRTLTCDRCGAERFVQGFSWGALARASDDGWSKYVSVTLRSGINSQNFKDLCPECTGQFAYVMKSLGREHTEVANDIRADATMLATDELKTLRDWMTREVRKRG